jgi:hypothetical protein
MDDKDKKIKELENRMKIISSIPQLSITSSLADVIIAINKITNSIKRAR